MQLKGFQKYRDSEPGPQAATGIDTELPQSESQPTHSCPEPCTLALDCSGPTPVRRATSENHGWHTGMADSDKAAVAFITKLCQGFHPAAYVAPRDGFKSCYRSAGAMYWRRARVDPLP